MKNSTIKINIGATRKKQIQDGFFDGRFVSRVQRSKKDYTRKTKHKNEYSTFD
jgi:hypothetical protein